MTRTKMQYKVYWNSKNIFTLWSESHIQNHRCHIRTKQNWIKITLYTKKPKHTFTNYPETPGRFKWATMCSWSLNEGVTYGVCAAILWQRLEQVLGIDQIKRVDAGIVIYRCNLVLDMFCMSVILSNVPSQVFIIILRLPEESGDISSCSDPKHIYSLFHKCTNYNPFYSCLSVILAYLSINTFVLRFTFFLTTEVVSIVLYCFF